MTKQGFWIDRLGFLRYRFTVETPEGHIEGRRLTHAWAAHAARRKIHNSRAHAG